MNIFTTYRLHTQLEVPDRQIQPLMDKENPSSDNLTSPLLLLVETKPELKGWWLLDLDSSSVFSNMYEVQRWSVYAACEWRQLFANTCVHVCLVLEFQHLVAKTDKRRFKVLNWARNLISSYSVIQMLNAAKMRKAFVIMILFLYAGTED